MEKINLAKLKKNGAHFEIVIDPDLAMEYKKKGTGDIVEILKSEKIFSDAHKGMIASETILKASFGTDDPIKIADYILKNGEIQASASFREKEREEKRKKILSIIHINGIDPKTNLPHPLSRIEAACEEVKVRFDEHISAELQVQDVLKKIRVVLPIKFVIKEIEAKIPSNYSGKAYGALNSFGQIIKEEWLNDGSLRIKIEIPGGLEADLYEKVNAITHGNAEINVTKIK
jgi:ribosome maturation protein SDO1